MFSFCALIASSVFDCNRNPRLKLT